MPKKRPSHPNLKYNRRYELWETKQYLAWLGQDVDIIVHAGDDGPTAQQLRLYKQILTRRRSLRKKIEKCVFDYYQEYVCGSFIVMTGDIWTLLTLTGVDIHDVADDDDCLRFTLNYAWKWDDEHGNTIFIEDWQIKDMGDSAKRFF